MLPIDEVFPDPSQPRQHFDKEGLERMTTSISSRGIIQPILVRWDDQRGCWVIISGECRWRGGKAAGLTEVPCLVVEGEPEEVDLLKDQIIENTIRNSLRPLELARSLAKLKALRCCDSKTLAKETGLSGSTITRSESLLTLPDDVQALVDSGAVGESIAYEISRMPDEARQREMAEAVAAGRKSRSQVIEDVQREVGRKKVRSKAARVSCRLDGGLNVTVSASEPLTWDSLLEGLDRIRKAAKKLCDNGKDVSALAQELRAL
jgi:ParB family chromosome partitioning protein